MGVKSEKTRHLLAGFLREGMKNGAAGGHGVLACMLYGAYKDKEADSYLMGKSESRRIQFSPDSKEYAQVIAGLLEVAISDEWTAWDWLRFGQVELLEEFLFVLQKMQKEEVLESLAAPSPAESVPAATLAVSGR